MRNRHRRNHVDSVKIAVEQELRLRDSGFHLSLKHQIDKANVPLGDAGLCMLGNIEWWRCRADAEYVDLVKWYLYEVGRPPLLQRAEHLPKPSINKA